MNSHLIDLAVYLIGGLCLLATLLLPLTAAPIPLTIAVVVPAAVILGRHVVGRNVSEPRKNANQDVADKLGR